MNSRSIIFCECVNNVIHSEKHIPFNVVLDQWLVLCREPVKKNLSTQKRCLADYNIYKEVRKN
jgi:hypothetical protein